MAGLADRGVDREPPNAYGRAMGIARNVLGGALTAIGVVSIIWTGVLDATFTIEGHHVYPRAGLGMLLGFVILGVGLWLLDALRD